MSDERDLEMLLNSHFPITTIETHEERRAQNLLKRVVARLGKRLHVWTVTEGLSTLGADSLEKSGIDFNDNYISPSNASKEPATMLKQVKNSFESSVILLLDFHPYLDDATIVRLLKEIALDQPVSRNTVVLLSHSIDVPPEIERLCASFSLSLPDSEGLERLIVEEAKVWGLKNKTTKLKADRKAIDMLVRNLQGLTTSDARRLIRNAIYNDGALTQDDIPAVMKAKYELLGQDGVLSFEYETAQFAEVGGFKKLIKWVTARRQAFLDNAAVSLDMPKGILLLGIQGGGKSLAAKAVAGAWEVPLLRIDFGALYNKFFGETEKNIRESLKTAELMSPCVMWMDEIEKGIAAGDYDSGTSKRVLGTLLTWMAENKKPVFIVATANDISSLPPELIRKGRMDEIFFVDLPVQEVRADIFAIHLNKRNQDAAKFDLALLAAVSEGFSGAEIEQAIVAALYSAHAKRAPVSTNDIVSEIRQTQPLSVVMAEKIGELRQWASGRTVTVN